MLIFVKMSQHYASNYFPFEFFIAGDENDMKLEQRIEREATKTSVIFDYIYP